jgi:hypothetical protein
VAGDQRGALYLGSYEASGYGGAVDTVDAEKWLKVFVAKYEQRPDTHLSQQDYADAKDEIAHIDTETAEAAAANIAANNAATAAASPSIAPRVTWSMAWQYTVVAWGLATWGFHSWLLKEVALIIDCEIIATVSGLLLEWFKTKREHLEGDEFLPDWVPKPRGIPNWVRRYWFGRWQLDPNTSEWQRVKYYN